MVSRFFKNAGCVIGYLGRYTTRFALSSNHISKIEDDLVTFKWHDDLCNVIVPFPKSGITLWI
ncbi:transposase [Desulfosporosinus sp.]|uniref:transposase n=1 Tax=Desulfosporosinus sp. TaxID=157907 RepID=UPI003433067F